MAPALKYAREICHECQQRIHSLLQGSFQGAPKLSHGQIPRMIDPFRDEAKIAKLVVGKDDRMPALNMGGA